MSTARRSSAVLLIEQNPNDADLARRLLAATPLAETYDVVHFGSIVQAMGTLDDPGFSAAIIGLEAPDISALASLKSSRTRAASLPTIALVRPFDEEFGIAAIRAGAQDSLFKDRLDGTVLSRSVRYGIERSRHSTAVDDATGKDEDRDEMEAWAAMCSPSPLTVARKSFGQSSLREMAPDAFEDLVHRYQEILDHALEEQAMRTRKGVAEDLKNLADLLGSLGAGPRDVVALHTVATTAKLAGSSLRKAKAYIVEGRLLLLKLMGDLASFYRNLSWGEAPGGRGRLPASKAKPMRARYPGMIRKKDGQ